MASEVAVGRAGPGRALHDAEDFPPALKYYHRHPRRLPGLGEAMVGRVQALSYHAIAMSKRLLQPIGFWTCRQTRISGARGTRIRRRTRSGPGRTSRRPSADGSEPSGQARRHRGVQRAELDRARPFRTATRLDRGDCDSHFYLGGVRPSSRSGQARRTRTSWPRVAWTRPVRACFPRSPPLRSADPAGDRKTRRIASRQPKIVLADLHRPDSPGSIWRPTISIRAGLRGPR